jgi:F-box/WD-40 domain protein MET30
MLSLSNQGSVSTRASFPIEFFGCRYILQSLDALSVQEREAVTICGFSSSSHPRRELVFQERLTMRCFSQLSLLIGQLGQLIRIDPFDVLPCELSLKVVAHLNATSLRRTAQVSEG